MSNEGTVRALRKELRDGQDRIEFTDGDILKFSAYKTYQYAAMRVHSYWYITGGGKSFGQELTDYEMVKTLKSERIKLGSVVYIQNGEGETI